METTKKISKQQQVFNYFLSLNSNYEFFKNDQHIFRYQKDTFFNVAIFSKRGTKPTEHFRFNSEYHREQYIQVYKDKINRILLRNEEYRMENLKEAEKYQKGEILVSYWGYEQTNVDFYLITERKNKTVTLQELDKIKNYSHIDMSGTCKPDLNKTVGEPFKKRITERGTINLATYKCCRLYNGEPQMFSSYA